MTLNEISAFIANQLNQPFNHELKERIKVSAKAELALYLRRSIERHGIDDSLKLGFHAEVHRVNVFDSTIIEEDVEDNIVKTKNKIPYPLRYSGDSPFILVATADRRMSLPKRSISEMNILNEHLAQRPSFSYDLVNNYIEIYDKKEYAFKGKYIYIEAIWENPEEILAIYEDLDSHDINLPIPLDLLSYIKDRVFKFYASVPQENIAIEHEKR
jgi:hypothetical protein